MLDRTFKIYAKDNGPFEIVPTGWSVLAAGLGPFWALTNGVFLKYVLLALPLFLLVALNQLAPKALGWISVAYARGALFVYFPLKAFAWHAQVLQSKGFTLQASIIARSAKEALRKYANDQAEA